MDASKNDASIHNLCHFDAAAYRIKVHRVLITVTHHSNIQRLYTVEIITLFALENACASIVYHQDDKIARLLSSQQAVTAN